jgi:hypothetical protein
MKKFKFGFFFKILPACVNFSIKTNLDFTRCLIHNAHLVKILSCCKVLDLRITHLKEMFDNYVFSYNIYHSIFGLIFQVKKNITLYTKLFVIGERKFQKLMLEM